MPTPLEFKYHNLQLCPAVTSCCLCMEGPNSITSICCATWWTTNPQLVVDLLYKNLHQARQHIRRTVVALVLITSLMPWSTHADLCCVIFVQLIHNNLKQWSSGLNRLYCYDMWSHFAQTGHKVAHMSFGKYGCKHESQMWQTLFTVILQTLLMSKSMWYCATYNELMGHLIKHLLKSVFLLGITLLNYIPLAMHTIQT